MTSDLGKRIKDLCESWIREATGGGGNTLSIGGNSERYRLTRNGIDFHTLNIDETRIAIVYLTKTLLHQRMNTVIDLDHKMLWSWVASLLLDFSCEYISGQEYYLRTLFSTVAHTSLVGVRDPNLTMDQLLMRNAFEQNIEKHMMEMRNNSTLILSYIVFPLLEAICKKHSHDYIDSEGMIKKEFKVKQKNGDFRVYKVGKRCSSLRDLLFLSEESCTPETLRYLQEMQSHIKYIDQSTNHAYDTIFEWRNSFMHGQVSPGTVGGTILGWCLLLSLDSIDDQYEIISNNIVQRLRFQRETSHISSRDMYPPF